MTKLNKMRAGKGGKLSPANVTRELASLGHKGKPLYLTLEMGDYITFRAKGTRRKYTIHAKNVYYLALMKFVQEEYERKLLRYQYRKTNGMRSVKPKKPRVFGVSPEALQALAMKA